MKKYIGVAFIAILATAAYALESSKPGALGKSGGSYSGSISVPEGYYFMGAGYSCIWHEGGNTAVGSPNDIIFKYSTGTEGMRIKGTTGNVGISSSTPTALLTVGAGANPSLKVETGGGMYPKSGAALPTTGISEGSLFYNTADKKLYVSTETVVGAYSWVATH